MRASRKVLTAFALLLAAPAWAWACSCAMPGERVCSRAWSAPVVFVGTVTGEAKAPPDAGDWLRRAFRFETEEVFRGGQAGAVELLTGGGGGDCGYNFVVGRRYLVYAHTNADGRLTTGICSATRPLEKAAEDVEYLRGLADRPPGAAVYGRVQFSGRDLRKGSHVREAVRGAKVLIEGGGARREVAADAEGKFQATDLPAGAYTARLVGPEGAGGGRTSQSFELAEKRCVELYFTLTWQSSVGGRVIGETGEPVRGARLSLAPAELAPHEFGDHQKTADAYTDEQGVYKFEQVPPGRYYVIVNAHDSPRVDEPPYPRTFLPGVEDPQHASIVKVGERDELADQNLRMPRKLVARELKGTVVWPDGRPAGKNASARLHPAAQPWRDVGGAEVDAQGRFTLKGWDGATFLVTVTVNLEGGKQMCAGPAEVTLDENTEAVRLVVQTPYGNCLANYRPAPKGR